MHIESKTGSAGPPDNKSQQANNNRTLSDMVSGYKPKPSVDSWPKTCLSCGAIVKSAGSHCCGH